MDINPFRLILSVILVLSFLFYVGFRVKKVTFLLIEDIQHYLLLYIEEEFLQFWTAILIEATSLALG